MIGHRIWAIPEGYIPSRSFSQARDLISHEAACILNATDATASIEITLYFENREPAGPYRLTLEPRRTRHLRFNDLSDPEPVPRDTPYSSVIRSDVEIVVQHTRLKLAGSAHRASHHDRLSGEPMSLSPRPLKQRERASYLRAQGSPGKIVQSI